MDFTKLSDDTLITLTLREIRELCRMQPTVFAPAHRTDEPIVGMTTKEFLTHKEAAAYLRVSTQTLYNWVSRDIIHVDKFNGKHSCYRRAVLDAYLASNLRLTPSELAAQVDAQLAQKGRKGGRKNG